MKKLLLFFMNRYKEYKMRKIAVQFRKRIRVIKKQLEEDKESPFFPHETNKEIPIPPNRPDISEFFKTEKHVSNLVCQSKLYLEWGRAEKATQFANGAIRVIKEHLDELEQADLLSSAHHCISSAKFLRGDITGALEEINKAINIFKYSDKNHKLFLMLHKDKRTYLEKKIEALQTSKRDRNAFKQKTRIRPG